MWATLAVLGQLPDDSTGIQHSRGGGLRAEGLRCGLGARELQLHLQGGVQELELGHSSPPYGACPYRPALWEKARGRLTLHPAPEVPLDTAMLTPDLTLYLSICAGYSPSLVGPRAGVTHTNHVFSLLLTQRGVKACLSLGLSFPVCNVTSCCAVTLRPRCTSLWPLPGTPMWEPGCSSQAPTSVGPPSIAAGPVHAEATPFRIGTSQVSQPLPNLSLGGEGFL